MQDGVISSTIDQGGPRRQLFGSLIQEIVKNSGNGFINFIEKEASYFPVLKSTKNKFNQEYANEKEYFHMLGQLLGVSIVNGSVIGPAFSLEIYSAIVDVFRLYYYYDVDRDCKELVFYVILKNVCPAYKDICNLIISSKLKIIDEDEACEIDDYCITDVDAAEHRSAFEGALYLIADYLDQDEKDKLALEANISNLEEIENLRKLYSSHPDVFYIASKHALICRLDTDDRDSFGMAAATLNLFEGFDLETKDMNCPALDDKEILLKDKSLKALEIKKLIEGSFDRDVLLESFIWDDYILDSTDNEMIELSTTIKTLFDQWFQSCSEEKLHQFLGATTGSLYMPKGLEVTLLLNADPERYPAATTCSKLLYLPRDIDPKGFNEKMDYFVAQYQSGSFQFQLQ